MSFLSIGVYMNQFNPKKKKKNTINHKKKKYILNQQSHKELDTQKNIN